MESFASGTRLGGRRPARQSRIPKMTKDWTPPEYDVPTPAHTEEDASIINGGVPARTCFLALGTAAFLLYAALYAVDLALIYFTFVPGYYLEVFSATPRVVLRYGNPRALRYPDSMRVALRHYAPGLWRAYWFGRQFAPGPVLRHLDRLVRLSARLETAAFSCAALLVASLWCRDILWPAQSPRRPVRQWSWSALLSPWDAFGVYMVVFALATHPKDIGGSTIGALAVFVPPSLSLLHPEN
jgi:hypothetical protein